MVAMLSQHGSVLRLGLAVLCLAAGSAGRHVSPSVSLARISDPRAEAQRCGASCLPVAANLALRGGHESTDVQVGCLSAFFSCFGRKAPEPPPPVVETTEFTTVVHFATADGEGSELRPFISGSCDGLGDWDLSKAVALQAGAGFARWEGTFRFPKVDATFFFKYVLLPVTEEGLLDLARLDEAAWEDGHNRELHVTESGQVPLGGTVALGGTALPHHMRHPINVELGGTALPHHMRHPLNVHPPCVDETAPAAPPLPPQGPLRRFLRFIRRGPWGLMPSAKDCLGGGVRAAA
ncbi:hypothetical protein T484DRAFT_1783990 [Baffinella frigidus]|nr:hypothetical protein T484DRAFT_1783990 [Cryptophyta sp. CCMP2293]